MNKYPKGTGNSKTLTCQSTSTSRRPAAILGDRAAWGSASALLTSYASLCKPSTGCSSIPQGTPASFHPRAFASFVSSAWNSFLLFAWSTPSHTSGLSLECCCLKEALHDCTPNKVSSVLPVPCTLLSGYHSGPSFLRDLPHPLSPRLTQTPSPTPPHLGVLCVACLLS